MQSKSTSSSKNKYDTLHENFSNLTSKVGVEKANEILFTLSQDSEYNTHGLIIKDLCASYFNISVLSITEEKSHWHSKIRSICFHILNKYMPMRYIGTQFNRRENSVHKGIESMELILKKPHLDKIIYTAYAQIIVKFEKIKLTQSLKPQREAIKESDIESVNERMRLIIKAEILKLNITVKDLAKMVPMPRTSLNAYLLGTKKSIKQMHLMNLQECLNIKIMTI